MQGLISPLQNTSVGIAPMATCPTGNCTFLDDGGVSLTTLDMCHDCEDLTSFVERRPFHYQTEPVSRSNGARWRRVLLIGSGGRNRGKNRGKTGGNLTMRVDQSGFNLTSLDISRGSSFPVRPWARSSILGF
ncbi:hypothetical protein ISF_07270 [Cordyceps fumosorosea ARSEF 2679]|uniref:Uncharacterized protein n=1 Tax=Cordyceps fumosorosea (strain ARSEF 2679) TaxID=1081104 RepID=A0A167PKJ3_CORFA|nr:hypothetical protein ISF_07270 [Cordyceps fumosorosea ARSEF 2679]OAA56754.1 hypothetical protein ISF_07270 [Cordyceps fumosorosea ARSEF 2679]